MTGPDRKWIETLVHTITDSWDESISPTYPPNT